MEARLLAVEAAYLGELDELERVKAEDFLERAKQAATEQWQDVSLGRTSSSSAAPRAHAVYRRDDEEVSPQASTEEVDGCPAELASEGRAVTAPHLQKELTRLQDCTRLGRLEETLRLQANWEQLERLRDLRHQGVSHQWLWHLDSSRGSVLNAADFVVNVQKRLGARIYCGSGCCRLCGGHLDPHLEHSETCATAEATRGHYACVRALVDGLRLADPSVSTEARGLTSTTARPADILTTAAVPGRSAALDVCIASSSAAIARGDAAEAAFKRKLRHYRALIPELAAAGVVYRPLVWTADGRPHPAVSRTLGYAAQLAASKAGRSETPKAFVRRWQHEVQIAILRRRAAMARAVLPAAPGNLAWLLTGKIDQPPCIHGRLPVLEEEEDEAGAGQEVRVRKRLRGQAGRLW